MIIFFKKKLLLSPLAAQCPPVGGVVHVVFVCQLQCNLQSIAQVFAGVASGEPGVFSGASMAACLVLKRL